MFRSVAKLDPADQLPGATRFERLVECPLGVRVEVVAAEDHFFTLGVVSAGASKGATLGRFKRSRGMLVDNR